jgi:hypothetical protein
VGARPFLPIVESEVAARVDIELGRAGVRGILITIEVVAEIPRTRLGKAPFIRRAGQHQSAVLPLTV